jgi:hypothetical protein
MRSGVIISAVGHVAVVLLAVLFTGVNPFESVATEAIAVEIVSPSEVPPDQPQGDTSEAGPANKSASEFNPQFDLALTPQPPTPPSPPPTKPTPPRQKEQQQSARQPNASSGAQQPATPPSATPQPAAKPSAAAPSAQPGMPVQMPPPATQEPDQAIDRETPKETNVADLFGMPLALPDGRLGGGFDTPAQETAKIDRSNVDAFRAHLRSCTMLPAGVSATERIALVLRVNLKPDGMLVGQPTLIEGSASAKGPALLQSLLSGLQRCQPYNMLPADKYREWKSLDVRFTPGDMGQG